MSELKALSDAADRLIAALDLLANKRLVWQKAATREDLDEAARDIATLTSMVQRERNAYREAQAGQKLKGEG